MKSQKKKLYTHTQFENVTIFHAVQCTHSALIVCVVLFFSIKILFGKLESLNAEDSISNKCLCDDKITKYHAMPTEFFFLSFLNS